MGLNVAVQMDPIGRINIDADSTFRIMEEAQARGHRLFYYTPDRLAFEEGRVTARGWPVEVRRVKGDHFTLGEETEIDLAHRRTWSGCARTRPSTWATSPRRICSSMLAPGTLVVNDPFWVRNFPEKLLVLRFPELTPPTTHRARPRDAAGVQGASTATSSSSRSTATAAPGCSGSIRTTATSRRSGSSSPGINREPLIAQKFLPDVAQGDKRIILVDGEPVGAINRVPAEGETRSNMHAGGRPEAVGADRRGTARSARPSGRCCARRARSSSAST